MESIRAQAAIGLVLFVCAGCSSLAATSAEPSPSASPSIVTVVATTGAIYPSIQIAGIVTPYRQVGIASDLAEPIVDVDVQEGDHVHAGQVLAHLLTDDLEAQLASSQRVVGEDVARYSQTAYQTNAVNVQDESAIRSAEATLHQARVNLAGASRDLKRYATLEASGYLSPETVDQQRTTVAGDSAAVYSAQAAVDQATANAQANGRGNDPGEQQQELEGARAAADAAQASVEQLRREIARAVIVSPFDGIVDAVNANPGEYPSGRQLFTIEQMASVYVLLSSSTSEIVQIHQGAAASIVVAGSTRKDHGKVVAVLDQLQPGTTNFTVKVLIPNPDGHLHAGMPVTAYVDLPIVRGVEIPVTAFIDDTDTSVYTVQNNIARVTKVIDVKDDGTNAIVTGISASSIVVKNVDAATVSDGVNVVSGVLSTATPATK
jgi:multidrug efflux pump subunit AcrA (membrane-fusion protein)